MSDYNHSSGLSREVKTQGEGKKKKGKQKAKKGMCNYQKPLRKKFPALKYLGLSYPEILLM